MVDLIASFLGALLTVASLVAIIVLYFLPTIIAYRKTNSHKIFILLLNFLLGWTFIVWIICFIWSIMNRKLQVDTTMYNDLAGLQHSATEEDIGNVEVSIKKSNLLNKKSIILICILLVVSCLLFGTSTENKDNLINTIHTDTANSSINQIDVEIKSNIDKNISNTFKGNNFKIIITSNPNKKYEVIINLDNTRFSSQYECCLVATNIIESLLHYQLDTYKKLSNLQFVYFANNTITYKVQVIDIDNIDKNYIPNNLKLLSSDNDLITFDFNSAYIENNGISLYDAEKLKQEEERKKQLQEEHKKYIEEQRQIGLNNFIEIRKAFKSNELAANDKYKDNTYTLCGEINAFNEDGLFNKLFDYIGVTITFKDGNYDVYTFCQFDISQRDTLMDYSVGDTILFSGKCYNWANWTECIIIE